MKDVVKNLIPPKGIARSVERSELLNYMTDAIEKENVVAGDIESTISDEEEEELEKERRTLLLLLHLKCLSTSLRLRLYA